MSGDISLYASIGARMVSFALDVEGARLEQRAEIDLPARVRYAYPHPRLPILYAACGMGETGQSPDLLCTLRCDADGSFQLMGDPLPLPARPMECATDLTGDHLMISYDKAPGLTMFRLDKDGRVGAELPHAEGFDAGVATHHAAVMPSNSHGVLVALGKRGFGTDKYIDGALKLFRFDRGQLESLSTVIPPDAGETGGFNPRNIKFHPTLPLAFVSVEGQNELAVFRRDGDTIAPAPLFVREVLADRDHIRKRQNLGSVHIHPKGHTVYLANRNDGYVNGHAAASWLNPDPIPVFPGGENNIVVFGLDPATGEPTLLQHIETRGIHPRTFSFDPSGRLLVVGNCAPTRFEQDGEIVDVPASLVLYRVADDGTLTFAHQHGIDVGSEKLWWSKIVAR